jgi:aerobic-type carbon monoxide dehydrogenase small subunit (CoxS/CutS family)
MGTGEDMVEKKRHPARKGGSFQPEAITLVVNGQTLELNIGDRPGEVEPFHTLSETLRETLGLTGTKVSCDNGACGACTVIMEGRAVLSCKLLTVECNGKSILTIEGLRDGKTGALDPLQQAFIDHTAFQCGFCTPGMIMAAEALLRRNPTPTDDEIRNALSGNLCRCTGYVKIIESVKAAAEPLHDC